LSGVRLSHHQPRLTVRKLMGSLKCKYPRASNILVSLT
jgi:hypothetical protein